MKKIAFSLSIALASIFAFTACDDDDDDEKSVEIAGTYIGTLNSMVSVMGQEIPVSQENVETTITKTGNTYTVTIKDFSYMNTNYGNIVVTDVTMEDGDSFIGEGNCTLTKDDTNYTATIEDLEGEKTGKNVVIEFDMHLPVSPKMTITFDIAYSGSENQQ